MADWFDRNMHQTICDALQQNKEQVAQAYFEMRAIVEVDIGWKIIHL